MGVFLKKYLLFPENFFYAQEPEQLSDKAMGKFILLGKVDFTSRDSADEEIVKPPCMFQ